MANEKHLYLVAKGSYIHTDLSAERWQTGVRLFVDKSAPDDSGTLPSTGDYIAAEDTGTGTNISAVSDWAWSDSGSDVIDVTSYMVDQAAPAFTDFMGAANISAKAQLDTLHLYPMLATGKVFEGRSCVGTFTSSVPGGETSNMLPPEISIALSLQTPQPGRRGRGRMYLPPASVSQVGTDGFLGSGVTTVIADAGVALMEALAIVGTLPSSTNVRPIVTGAPWNRYGVVMSVNVGDVFDAQRRRRRQLVETRHSEDVTYS